MTGPTARRVPLTHNPTTLVDEADFERVMAAGPWQYGRAGALVYAQRTVYTPGIGTRAERLHTFLTGWPLVDHINGNGLDNRRANLRPATPSQNNANSTQRLGASGYRGVTWHKPAGLWRAYVSVGGRQKSIGYFHDVVEAAKARDRAAREAHGEFARLNFPEEQAA